MPSPPQVHNSHSGPHNGLAAILKVDLVEHPLVVSPLGFYLDVQIEEHARLEVRFERHPRRRSDLLDHLAALADDDALLRFALHQDRAIELEERPLALIEAIDDDRR